MKVEVGLVDGSRETWTSDDDHLHHVEVSPSGAFMVYEDDGSSVGRFRAARALGTWLTADRVDEP